MTIKIDHEPQIETNQITLPTPMPRSWIFYEFFSLSQRGHSYRMCKTIGEM
jgi:hypothetical protein